jgi:hypothetical protein
MRREAPRSNRASLALVAVLLAACGSPATQSPAAPPSVPTTPTVEHRLALIEGDPSSEDEFGRILDRLQAGIGACAPDPNRPHIGDVLVTSWRAAESPESLLVWARSTLAACGG